MEMAELIGITRRSIAKIIAKLQAEGMIRRVGPDKGGHWETINCWITNIILTTSDT